MSRLLEFNSPLGQDNTDLLSVTTGEHPGTLPACELTLKYGKSGVGVSECLDPESKL